jgi:hypothetical protein
MGSPSVGSEAAAADHVIALDERHLKRLLSQYVSYYHDARTHLELDKQTPAGRARSLENGTVICQKRDGRQLEVPNDDKQNSRSNDN